MLCCAMVLLGTFAAGASLAQDQPPPLHLTGHAILVKKIASSEVKLPAAFQYAIYEYTLQEMTKTGRFQTVYREGDSAAAGAADLLTLETDATGFKEGSARARQVTTVAGATTIKVHMKLLDKDGKVVLERDLQGKVRFFGENLRATYALAKSEAKLIKYNFDAPKPAKH
jgi:hypothetical protein